MKNPMILLRLLLASAVFLATGCRDKEAELAALKAAIDEYESAWAAGDFLKVESFFTEDAKRLHTEPHVWDRAEIRRYFESEAAATGGTPSPEAPADWKAGREYLEIRVEGDIGYDIFTTDRFKALHIWERQADGTWKIKYDMGMLNHPGEE